MNRRTVTLKEAQRILGIGRDRLRAALKSGQVPGIKLGKRYIISRDALDDMLRGDKERQ